MKDCRCMEPGKHTYVQGTSKRDTIVKAISIHTQTRTDAHTLMKSVSAVQPASTYRQIMNVW